RVTSVVRHWTLVDNGGGGRASSEAARINPGVNRKLNARILTGVVRNLHKLSRAVQTERMFDFARRKSRAAVQRAVVLAANVVRVSLARPPGDHARRRWN